MAFPQRLWILGLTLLAWLAILLGSAALALRERHRPPEARRWWASHGIWIWLGGPLALGYALAPADRPGPSPIDDPVRRWMMVVLPAVALAGIAWDLLQRRISTVGRAQRKAQRGDLAGAIADVEAALGPHLEVAVAVLPGGPTDAASDPWAPPETVGPSSRDRVALAGQLNLLAWLEAQRGNWARALGLFERADGLGTGLMIYRTNRAEALLRLGLPDEAGELIDQALAAVPEHNSAQSVQLLTEAASRLAALGRLDEARAALGRADRHWRQLGPLRLAHRGLHAPLRAARAALDRAPAAIDAPD